MEAREWVKKAIRWLFLTIAGVFVVVILGNIVWDWMYPHSTYFVGGSLPVWVVKTATAAVGVLGGCGCLCLLGWTIRNLYAAVDVASNQYSLYNTENYRKEEKKSAGVEVKNKLRYQENKNAQL